MLRTAVILGVAGVVAVGGLFAGARGEKPEQPEGPKPPRVFCMSRAGLLEAKAGIARNDPLLRVSFEKLLRQADKALKAGPFSVMDKTKVPPSGDKHDYMSIAPYAWPDPKKKDGLPYIARDGRVNPQWWQDYDRVPLERMTQAVETLALAHYLTGKQVYGQRAARMVRVWFLDRATRMTPDLKYAQGIPGRPGKRAYLSRWSAVIDVRFFSRLMDAVGLLGSCDAWTDQDQAGMVQWCRTFLDNVRPRFDPTHKARGQNLSSWYHATLASLALFVGDDAQARKLIERARKNLTLAIAPDGTFPHELTRTRSLSYSCFHIYALFNLATMGEQVGVDLWSYQTKDGRGLHKALDFLARYSGPEGKKKWPYKEIENSKGEWWDPYRDQKKGPSKKIEGAKGDWWVPYRDQLPCVLYRAARVYQDKRYEACATKILQDELAVSRLHLMSGMPIRWWASSDSDSD